MQCFVILKITSIQINLATEGNFVQMVGTKDEKNSQAFSAQDYVLKFKVIPSVFCKSFSTHILVLVKTVTEFSFSNTSESYLYGSSENR